MDEGFFTLMMILTFGLGSCVGCATGESSMTRNNQNKMIELNLAHYDQKTGMYTQDSISCINDSCVVIRKNGE